MLCFTVNALIGVDIARDAHVGRRAVATAEKKKAWEWEQKTNERKNDRHTANVCEVCVCVSVCPCVACMLCSFLHTFRPQVMLYALFVGVRVRDCASEQSNT